MSSMYLMDDDYNHFSPILQMSWHQSSTNLLKPVCKTQVKMAEAYSTCTMTKKTVVLIGGHQECTQWTHRGVGCNNSTA